MSGAFTSVAPADPLVTAWLDTSDLGNAKRLVSIAMGRLLWVEDADAFAHYDGRRWSLERGGIEAQRMAHRVIEHIDGEAEALGELADDAVRLRERVGAWCSPEIAQKRVEVLRGWAVRSGSAGATAGMLKQVRSLVTAALEDFDADPLIYNVENCTLRFVKDGDSWRVVDRPHDQGDMLMSMAAVAFERGAPCPFWHDRLAMLTPDREQLDAFQVLYGYTLTGLTSDQAFYVHQGKGGDGKSVTHMTIAALHGDYYRHAGVKTFLQGTGQKGGAEHRSDLVRLKGDVRFVTCDEPPPRSVWDGETIKQITGSLITARGANERTETTYRPRFKLHAECNIIPRAPSDDKGFRRRFKVYQWQVSLDETPAGAIAIDLVLARLEAEKSGILNWLIEGALAWLTTRRVPQPSAMTAVLSDFWADSSPLLEWMAEWCDTSDPQALSLSSELYNHFKNWCEENGQEKVMSSTAFGVALRDKQYGSAKDGRGKRMRRGIQLRMRGMFTAPAAAAEPSRPTGNDLPQPADDWGDDGLPP